MKTNRQSILCALALIFTSTVAAHAQQDNMIRGKVRNSSGQNLRQMNVDLLTGNGSLINQTVTNNEGDFYFSGLTETGYVVAISSPLYQPVTERVDFSTRAGVGQPGETRSVELTLVPKESARLSPPRATFVQDVPPPARAAYERGLKAAKEGRAPAAIESLQEAVKLFPAYFDAHLMLGSELLKLNRLDEAIAMLEQARKVNSRDDRVYQMFGLVMMAQKKFQVAAAAFAEATRLNALDPQSFYSLAVALIEQTTLSDAQMSKSEARARLELLEQAATNLTHAFELSGKKLASVYLQFARIHERKGQRSLAANDLEQYLKSAPDAKNAVAIRETARKLRIPPNAVSPPK